MAGNYRGEQLVVAMLEKEVAGWLKNVNWTSLFIYARKKVEGRCLFSRACLITTILVSFDWCITEGRKSTV